MEEVRGYLKLDKSRQHDFLYPFIFQEYISGFAQDHRSVLLENVDVDYDKNFSFLLFKRLINRMYQQNHLALFTNANGSKQNAFWGHNENLYSQMLFQNGLFLPLLEVFQKCLRSNKKLYERMDRIELENGNICTSYTFHHHFVENP